MTDRADRIEAATATTEPFTAEEPHTRLAALAGRWGGTTRTWLDPSAPPDEARTEASIEAILGGRFLRVAYEGTCTGKRHAGEMVFAFHTATNEFELSWMDSFHTDSSIMFSTGALRDDGTIALLGSYGACNERWGWRTELRATAADELVIAAFNITPRGQATPAVETTLVRAITRISDR